MVLSIKIPVSRKTGSTEDVIDLGGPLPKSTRPRRSVYTPNPRLYPGPKISKPKVKKRAEECSAAGEPGRGSGGGRARRRKRAVRRAVVPNPRLYRAAPRAPAPPPPPPLRPRASWAPAAPDRSLDTASRVALRIAEQRARPLRPLSPARSSQSSGALPRPPPQQSAQASRLVVTLPGESDSAPRYRPLSQHFRLRSLDTDSSASTPPPAARRRPPPAGSDPPPPAMTTSSDASFTAEDGSVGNDCSAPSEYLAEFLSAIMRRQYAEALKYCRLILQYEPHNATARGFYPLLQQKLGLRPKNESVGTSSRVMAAHVLSSESSSSGGGAAGAGGGAGAAAGDASDGESAESCTSLSLDSSARSSRSPSPAAAHTHSSEASRSGRSDGSEARCTSSASPGAGTSRSDPYPDAAEPGDKGAAAGAAAAAAANDSAAGGDNTHLLRDPLLQQLRAQFACSIK